MFYSEKKLKDRIVSDCDKIDGYQTRLVKYIYDNPDDEIDFYLNNKQNKINTFLFALIIFTSVAFGTYGYFSAETRYGVYALPSQFLFLLSFFILVRFSLTHIKYDNDKEFWTKAVKLIKKVQYNNPKEVNHYYRNIDNIFKTKKSNSDNIKN